MNVQMPESRGVRRIRTRKISDLKYFLCQKRTGPRKKYVIIYLINVQDRPTSSASLEPTLF